MEKFYRLEEFGAPIQQVVMPIVTKVFNEVRQVGTGFIISPDGLMMTAGHVLIDAERKAARVWDKENKQFINYYELYALHITNEVTSAGEGGENTFLGGLWPIDKCWAQDQIDIGLCQLRQARKNGEIVVHKPLRLSPATPKIGQPVTAFGYHKTEALFAEEGDIFRMTYSHDTAFSRGEVTNVYNQGYASGRLPFPVFETNARFDGGMSGGPIMNTQGDVCGVVCYSSIPDHDRQDYLTYGASIWPACGLKIEATRDVNVGPQSISMMELIAMGNVRCDHTIEQVRVELQATGNVAVSYVEK